MSAPTVSVVVPTRNAAPYIGALLHELQRQTQRLEEILVVDSSSRDGTATLARRAGARVWQIPVEHFDHARTRQAAAAWVSSDIVVFMTQDALPVDEGAIARLVLPFTKIPNLAATFGRQLPRPGASPLSAHLRHFNYGAESYVVQPEAVNGSTASPFLSNAFAAYRQEALVGLQAFGPSMISSEDYRAAATFLGAGLAVGYVADAEVYHSHEYSCWQEVRRYFDIGVAHATQGWILDRFGGPGRQGRRYVRSAAAYLKRTGHLALMPELATRVFLKYLGYRLGRAYYYLPAGWGQRLSMNKQWQGWQKDS